MPYFWDYMNFGRGHPENQRKLQDGLFQIASQTCSLLVQVNNTNNISFGSNTTNVHCNTIQTTERPKVSRGASSQSHQDDDQFMVLLPSTSKGVGFSKQLNLPKPRLSTVLENGSFSHEEEGDFLGQGYTFRDDDTVVKRWSKSKGWCRPSCIPISIILILIFLVVLLPLLDHAIEKNNLKNTGNWTPAGEQCSSSCRISLTESLPDGIIYPPSSTPFPSTYQSWMDLVASAESTIEIGSFYWTLRKEDVINDPSSQEGEQVFQALLKAGTERGITVKIAQNAPTQQQPNLDTEYLVKRRAAQVRSLNFAQLIGAGVLHTKLWIVDRKHFYLGSANMDWRALTQIQEMGILVKNCSCLAEDVAKIFDVYWQLGEEGKIPYTWPVEYNTKINIKTPVNLTLNNNTFHSYLSSSPPQFSPEGRTDDIDAILNVIKQAEKFIYITVMDYFPLMIYSPKTKYWPVIDDALKTAAIEHKVTVRLLISWWKHSRPSEDYFLKSLQAISNSYNGVKIEVRRFIVPSTPSQDKIPFARVNHNKFMVTDNTAYIGTSNWSGDYFTNTAGIGFIFHDPVIGRNETDVTLRSQLQKVFERNWNSKYAHPLNYSTEF